jgi:hypothetical protein
MENKSLSQKLNKFVKDIMPLCACEILIALLTILGGAALDLVGLIKFNYTIISGVLLGCVVCILNYHFLALSVDKAVNNYMELRGSREMSDEEAEKFAAENSAPIQNAIKLSFIIRTASMLITLLVAFLTKWFNPLATAIPLLAFRPLISIIEAAKSKNSPAPNPEKFIKYDNEDEKESDD